MTLNFKYENYTIKPACIENIEAICAIWKEGVTEQKHLIDDLLLNEIYLKGEFLKQIENQDSNFKFWLCLNENDKIVGWQSIFPFHLSPNPMVKQSFAQSSTYIMKEYQNKGIGKLLLSHALKFCTNYTTVKYVFGLVLNENTKSLKMCDEIGFVNMGLLPKKQSSDFPNWNFIVYET